MRAAAFLALAMVLLVFAACTKQVAQQTDNTQQPATTQSALEPEQQTEQYIWSQFVDPNETVEIGEMI